MTDAPWLRECTVTCSPGIGAACAAVSRENKPRKPAVTRGNLAIWASVTGAADEGYSDATIAALLGHSQRSVTARHYIRRPDDALVTAADRTAKRVAAIMGGAGAQVLSFNARI
jgi:hypothetical protein